VAQGLGQLASKCTVAAWSQLPLLVRTAGKCGRQVPCFPSCCPQAPRTHGAGGSPPSLSQGVILGLRPEWFCQDLRNWQDLKKPMAELWRNLGTSSSGKRPSPVTHSGHRHAEGGGQEEGKGDDRVASGDSVLKVQEVSCRVQPRGGRQEGTVYQSGGLRKERPCCQAGS
jgi:hypothetical protein